MPQLLVLKRPRSPLIRSSPLDISPGGGIKFFKVHYQIHIIDTPLTNTLSIHIKTSQELRMLSSVTLNCQKVPKKFPKSS